MARPRKEGMDYFPHDTDASNDEKIEILRGIYGNDGYVFYFIMLERIYRSNDFQIDVSDAETREEMFQILSRKIAVSLPVFEKILNTCMKYNLFDSELYNSSGIITSKGIKKRSETVLDKRKKMQKIYNSNKKGVSDAETREETNTETKEETLQRKEKKSKEKESNILYIKLQNSDLVKLTEEQYNKLLDKFNSIYVNEKIIALDGYLINDPVKYKNHYLTLNNWLNKDGTKALKKDEPRIKTYTEPPASFVKDW